MIYRTNKINTHRTVSFSINATVPFLLFELLICSRYVEIYHLVVLTSTQCFIWLEMLHLKSIVQNQRILRKKKINENDDYGIAKA
jgi:hypothetical protein